MMDVRGAVLHARHEPWTVQDLKLDEPHERELLVRVLASGLCHSDDHIVTGDMPYPLPQVGGHEPCGIVEKVGPCVTRFSPGDKIVTCYQPACGHCNWCAQGMQAICDNGKDLDTGFMIDGTPRFFLKDGTGVGACNRLGSFANWIVVSEDQAVRIDPDLPPEKACLVSCGVLTGFGAMTRVANARPAGVYLTMGCGGVGMNSVQGAKLIGARVNIAIDPAPFKRQMALTAFGATHAFATIAEARGLINQETNGQGVDGAVVAVGVTKPEHIGEAFSVVRKRGICAVIGLGAGMGTNPPLPIDAAELVVYAKELRGVLFGSCNFDADAPNILAYYKAGKYNLDDMVTRTYKLDEINQGYADMHAGINMRGVIVHEH